MKYQAIKFGTEHVLALIAEAVEKTRTALNIQMSPKQVEMLTDDIYELYQTESIEDVLECLKAGRKGYYGQGFNQRGTFNMFLVKDWMQQHLDSKIAAREQKFEEDNRFDNVKLPKIDYEAYKLNKEKTKPKPEEKQIVNPNAMNDYMISANKRVEKIRDKVFQRIELTESEEEFLKHQKIEIVDNELFQRLD